MQQVHLGGYESQLTSSMEAWVAVAVRVGWDVEEAAAEGPCSASWRRLFEVGGSKSASESDLSSDSLSSDSLYPGHSGL